MRGRSSSAAHLAVAQVHCLILFDQERYTPALDRVDWCAAPRLAISCMTVGM